MIVEHNRDVLVDGQHFLQRTLIQQFLSTVTVQQVTHCPVGVVRPNQHLRVGYPNLRLVVELLSTKVTAIHGATAAQIEISNNDGNHAFLFPVLLAKHRHFGNRLALSLVPAFPVQRVRSVGVNAAGSGHVMPRACLGQCSKIGAVQ